MYLISPPPVSNTSPIDNVDPPDSVLTIDESDRIFSDNNDDSDEVKIVFQDTQESDSDTIQYLPSPTYHLSPSSDVTTQRLTPRLTPTSTPGSTTRSSIRCITPELSTSGPTLSAKLDGLIAIQIKMAKAFFYIERIH